MTKMQFLVQVVQRQTDKQTYTLKHYQSAYKDVLIAETHTSNDPHMTNTRMNMKENTTWPLTP